MKNSGGEKAGRLPAQVSTGPVRSADGSGWVHTPVGDQCKMRWSVD